VIAGLVSVVMPAFDEEAFIGEAIRSVLAQTHQAIELIVVDDGSTDETAAIAASFTEVRVVTRLRTGGPAAARNTGLAEARGEYWTIFDADDVMPRDRVAPGVAHLKANGSIDLVLGRTEAFVTPGEPRPSHWNPVWDAGPYHGHPGTALGRRSVLDDVGRFDESLPLGSDMQWLVRAKLAGVGIGRIDDLCLRYRIHAGNVTRDVGENRANMLTALRTARTFNSRPPAVRRR
jgi:glycosyltransferase involved in cell wall biosynthesis